MLKPYENYKPSGLKWIGNVPNHWNIIKLKYFARIINGSTPDSGDTAFWDGDVVWITPTDLGKLDDIYVSDSQRKITALGLKSCGTTLVPVDSIILTTRAPIGNVAISAVQACTNQGCKSLIIKDNDTKFHYFQLVAFREYLEALGTGTTFKELSTNALKEIPFPVPSKKEQCTITDFLDYKTDQIETFIQNRQAQIRLLREQRQSLINRAVAQGIRPGVKTKPSGVDWIGEIPANWEVKRLKFLTKRITNGFVGPTRDILKDSGVKYIQALHVKQNSIIFNEPYYVSEAWSLQHPRSILQAGDLVITQTGAYTGDVGIIPNEFERANCHALIILKPDRKKVIPQYLLYVLSSHFGQSLLYSIRTGSMHPHLNSTIVCDIFLPYVSDLSEQQAIIDYIKAETGRLDELIGKYKKQIGYMSEYKTALISQAVTGKIDVRDWQPPATRPTVRSQSNFTENVLVEEETP